MQTSIAQDRKPLQPMETSKATIQNLVKSQRTFFATGKTRDVEFRLAALRKLQDLIVAHEKEIADALLKDFNKPYQEAFSTEVANVLGDIKHVMKHLRGWAKPKKVASPLLLMPAKSHLYSEPYGCTLVIAPWNYPFQLQISPLVGAIAAGNTAIIKPSEITVNTQKLLVDLISKNFPPEYIAAVGGGVTESQLLLEEKFDFIFFTGSTRVGKIVMEKAAKHLTPVCLELGGKSPCVVTPDIDIKIAAKRIIWGKFLNAGQSCVAPDYIAIHSSIYEKFLTELKNTIVEFYGENPRNNSDYARVVNETHFDRIVSYIDKSKLFFGGQSEKSALYVAPTILRDVAWNDRIMEDEVFGPVMPCFKYDDISTLLSQIAERPKPLAFYLFTNDTGLQERVLANMSYGGACVNDTMVHLINPNLPFGGVGDSGMGGYHGKFSFDVFSHKKSAVRKPFALDATMRYPPYTDFKLKLIRFFMK